MAYNFKSIADVEVVAEPAESANVLIEENGVIKKAPKTAVGGGSTEWDAVIDLGADTDDMECALWEGAHASAKFVSGGYDAIIEKLNNNEMPNILLCGTTNVYNVNYAFKARASAVTTCDNKNRIRCAYNAYLFPYGGFAWIEIDETNTFTSNAFWQP